MVASEFQVGRWLVAPSLNRISADGTIVQLEPKVMQVLVRLAEQPGEVVSREHLIGVVWKDTFVTDDVLKRSISELRKALGDDARDPAYIETIARGGYRLIAPVVAIRSPEPSTPAAPDRGAVPRWRLAVVCAALGACVAVVYVASRSSGAVDIPRIVPFTAFAGDERAPAFSPDGQQIAFAWTGDDGSDAVDLYAKIVGAERALRLTTRPSRWISPAWSPDGRWIAFSRIGGGADGLYRVSPLGGAEQKLADVRINDPAGGQVSWSPDGKLIAFTSHDVRASQFDLFLLDADTLERQKVGLPSGCYATQPAFAPDGRRLAFVCDSLSPGEQGFFVWPLADRKPYKVGFLQGRVLGLTWAPDGQDLIAAVFEGYASRLWRVPLEGKPELLPFGDDGWFPAVSQASRRLAFSRWSMKTDIWRLDLTTGTGTPRAVRLVSSSRMQGQPQYSPDGRKIVFTSVRSGSTEIWVCDSDGANLSQLTTLGDPVIGTPKWAPDRGRIVFDSRSGGRANLYVVSSNGGAARPLPLSTADNSVPNWSRDGRSMYYVSSVNGTPQIWKARAEGGQAVQLTRNGGWLPVESRDRETLFYETLNQQIWTIPVAGGEEGAVPEMPKIRAWGEWTLGASGIYFVEGWQPPLIRFYDFGTRRTTTIVELPINNRPSPWAAMSVSPDGRFLLYTQFEQSPGDIVLVENFR